MTSLDSGTNWRTERSKLKTEIKIREEYKKTKHANVVFDVSTGFQHPVGKIQNRFGPGLVVMNSVLFRNIDYRIGLGLNFGFHKANEKISLAPNHFVNGKEKLRANGMTAAIPILFDYTFLETKKMVLRMASSVGFRVDYLNPQASEFGVSSSDSNQSQISYYKITRVGVEISQSLKIGILFNGPFRKNPRHINRQLIYFQLGAIESRMWSVKKEKEILSSQMAEKFGLELWPFISLGYALYL